MMYKEEYEWQRLAELEEQYADWINPPLGEIAPHEGQEIQLVLNGTKPLAVIEERKQPDVYNRAVDSIDGLHTYVRFDDDSGYEAVVVDNRNVGLVKEYLDAMELPTGTQSQRNARHRTLGRLFGYSEADIHEFIMNQPTCNCSKCTGGTK